MFLAFKNPLNAQTPPITPAWALGHIVWEDSLNNETGAKSIVDGYLDRNIPVDAVIIDSPWSFLVTPTSKRSTTFRTSLKAWT